MSNKNTYRRKNSIRLAGYDYAQEGLYFLTLCVQDRVHLFGRVREGKMILNPFGEIAYDEWANTPSIRDNISLGAFIIMPNHMHGIIQIKFQKKEKSENERQFKSQSQSIGAIIRGFKGAATKRIKELIINSSGSTGVLQYAPTAPTASDPENRKDQEATTEKIPSEIIKNLDLSKSLWQRSYYDHIIRNQQGYENIHHYIINNPEKWEEDKFYHQ